MTGRSGSGLSEGEERQSGGRGVRGGETETDGGGQKEGARKGGGGGLTVDFKFQRTVG